MFIKKTVFYKLNQKRTIRCVPFWQGYSDGMRFVETIRKLKMIWLSKKVK